MKKLAFDNAYYLKVQRENINKRIATFGDKLYLEFGGKLFDDLHAARVLPGFHADAKLQMLLGLKDKTEIVITVNTGDIISNKFRNDIGISYQDEVVRLIGLLTGVGLYVGSVVLSFYQPNPIVEAFEQKLNKSGVKTYHHYKINGYPHNIPLILSEDGLGKNDYIETTKPLVVITAPGPGSGKMATCLSQLYHENIRGIRAGYAKYETFPVWNLPLMHPVNLAYEAATVDLADVNMIDPFHLEKYGKVTINYNRDVEVFPLLRSIFEKIWGDCPYFSPTDMGVNMVGFGIKHDEGTCEASKQEIVRRYYQALKNNYLGKFSDAAVEKAKLVMNQVGVDTSYRKCVAPCLKKYEETNLPVVSIQLPNGKIVTGKKSELLTAPAAALINALKALAKIDNSYDLISSNLITPIRDLKVNDLHHRNPSLHVEEVLIILALQASSNQLCELAIAQVGKIKGAQAHASNIMADVDLSTYKKLGIDVTEEPISYANLAK